MLIFLLASLLTFEHAKTPQEIAWGMMDRQEIPDNHGMLFHFEKVEEHTFWMFNCYLDLDLAFLDEEGKILEIHALEAHPEILDEKRPVHSLRDLRQYSYSDPVLRFFREQAVHSQCKAKYALEVPAGTLARLGLDIGDTLDVACEE